MWDVCLCVCVRFSKGVASCCQWFIPDNLWGRRGSYSEAMLMWAQVRRVSLHATGTKDTRILWLKSQYIHLLFKTTWTGESWNVVVFLMFLVMTSIGFYCIGSILSYKTPEQLYGLENVTRVSIKIVVSSKCTHLLNLLKGETSNKTWWTATFLHCQFSQVAPACHGPMASRDALQCLQFLLCRNRRVESNNTHCLCVCCSPAPRLLVGPAALSC